MSADFPKGFRWGASTSAHQVEGGQRNSWTRWEQANAKRLASIAQQRFGVLSAWPKIKAQAQEPDNYISGAAADHWHIYDKDFDLLQELDLNTYRLSIEWSRVEPEDGRFDEAAIAHYQDMVKALKKRGVEPFVTLWHWPLPLWLDDRGGWLAKDAVPRFAAYVQRMAAALPQVKFWIPLNEPEAYTAFGYFTATWPPARRSLTSYFRARRQLMRAHRAAYELIKSQDPEAQVGIATEVIRFEGIGALGRFSAHLASWWGNRRIIEAALPHLDFIGLNHYFHIRIKGFRSLPAREPTSDLGWELSPLAMYDVLMWLRRYNRPIYITENGLADADDSRRASFIRQTLQQVHRAISDGADVRGYLHWSLLDNFEWDKGFWPRFGLVEVDYTTQKRTIRPSARAYGQIAKRNALED